MTLMEPIKPAAQAGITCTVADLRRAVNAAAFVVERRNTIPVLGCLRIEPLNDKLRIEGTNLDSWLMVDCPATCTKGEPFVIDARLLIALLTGAERDDSVSITLDGNVVTLRIGPAVARVQLLCLASDWPSEPGTKGMSWVSIPEAALAKMIGRVRWAISTEETRYYLNGIYMHGRDGRLACAATDGHRLALYRADAEWPLPDLIFPRYSVAALHHLMTHGGNQPLRIGGSADPVRMQISGHGWTLTVKCIDGAYPDYTRVIPDRGTMRGYAVINRALLRRVPNTRSLHHLGDALKFDLSRKVANLSSVSLGVDVEMPIEADGDFSIGFNQRYVREIASIFDTVRIEASTASDAALILTEDPDLTVVLMPMRV
ncbi:DNA polymerase III beta subunit [Paracoccus phage vB_PthS_Pthi1]|uniref:Beta sliding clamp n=1 Tax=Paracoccus thiocyanatus TaxID=34006 RepID=A0A1N6SGS8_9RHOB|nr:DNA polymerase III subunit beta [Paracoccus thiocyanatus]AZV00373.1 DNA polymerase III beta subunit [Paracoccus phage vB_PthS_Pthi1]SIQ40355.1 DNA polymerase-3 subunit beta [Paracoccus thiocyanatus]